METWIRDVMEITGMDYSSASREYEATHDDWDSDDWEYED